MENALLPFGRCDDQYPKKSVAGAAAHVRAARDGSISRREALSAAPMARADRAEARSRVLSHQLLPLHLLRLLRGGLSDLRDSAHARLRNGRVQTPKPGL